MNGYRVLVEGHPWHVRSRGWETPAVLAIHGFTGSGRTWDALPGELRGRAVIAPDLPGHGGTPARDMASVENTAEGLVDLARQLGSLPLDVLGYSMGARVALYLAIAQPKAVRRLVLESPSAGIADQAERARRRAADEERAAYLDLRGLLDFLGQWEKEPVLADEVYLSPAVRARIRDIRAGQTAAGLAASLRAAGQGVMPALYDRLGEITAPTLVIIGGKDPARARAEAVAAGIPGARLVVIPWAGHAPHLSCPDDFHAHVRDFLKAVDVRPLEVPAPAPARMITPSPAPRAAPAGRSPVRPHARRAPATKEPRP